MIHILWEERGKMVGFFLNGDKVRCFLTLRRSEISSVDTIFWRSLKEFMKIVSTLWENYVGRFTGFLILCWEL